MKKFLKGEGMLKVGSSVAAAALGLLFGLVVMLLFKPSTAFEAFRILIMGGASNGLKGVGQVLYYTAPYIMVGLSVAFSFNAGVFNIGAAGQFTVGSFVAILIGGLGTGIPSSVRWIVALVVAGIAGMVWGLIPGIMKAYLHSNEVVTCIMMNYIAIYLVNQGIQDLYYDQSLVSTKYVMSDSLIPTLGLDKLFPGSSAGASIFLAIIACIIIYIVLYKTGFGFGLRASGMNYDASRYAGINDKRNIILVFAIAGLISGIGGGFLHLSSITKLLKVQEVSISEAGFSIPIALLACTHPIGVIFAALFLAWITVGGSLMQAAGFPAETVDMITAIIIYCSAFSMIFSQFFARLAGRRAAHKNKKGGE